MKIGDITDYLAQIAPPAYQEDYDNAGLLVGNREAEAQKALVCLDCTTEVIEEAIEEGCNLVISHHPLIFKSLKRLTGANHVERTVIKAIKNDIAIYAIHTNLDNVQRGVNAKICEKLKLTDLQILAPKTGLLKKLTAQCSPQQVKALRKVLRQAGIGAASPDKKDSSSTPPVTTPSTAGKGTHLLSTPSAPAGFGRSSTSTSKIETVFPSYLEQSLINALMNHTPPENFSYEIIPLDNDVAGVGSGMIGKLSEPLTEKKFLQHIKKTMKTDCIRHTTLLDQKVQTVAVCGGAGSFLLNTAISAGADFFISADFKYHDFFNAEQQLVVADIGHYESEQYTIDLLHTFLQKKFPNFAVRKTEINTNPVHYF